MNSHFVSGLCRYIHYEPGYLQKQAIYNALKAGILVFGFITERRIYMDKKEFIAIFGTTLVNADLDVTAKGNGK